MSDAASLPAVQRWMQDALVFPRLVARDETERLLASSGRLSGAEGLAIYQRGYFLRIASCMREQFPALCHALGAPLFNDFVADYIRERPPESHTLYDLGRRFPAFLEESRPDREAAPAERESWIDFMVDLANFERQVFMMFDAPGHEGKAFADHATPDRRLRLQPCFALCASRFPVADYYHAVRLNRPTPLPAALRELRRPGPHRLCDPDDSVERVASPVSEGDGRGRRCRRRDRRRRTAHGHHAGGCTAILVDTGRRPPALDRPGVLHRLGMRRCPEKCSSFLCLTQGVHSTRVTVTQRDAGAAPIASAPSS